MTVKDCDYFIIGGVPKAGTTSVYKYLADHPKTCASTLKETRFFLDENDSLPSVIRFNGSNLERYSDFWSHCEFDKILMEATPDYLYSDNALEIAELLPRAKMMFVTRDPIERLVSWYKFAKQRGLIKNSMSFEEYVHIQLNEPVGAVTPVHFRALEQGRYERYLVRFRQKMPGKVLEVDFDELRDKPLLVMNKICSFLNIDQHFYDNYTFSIENKSVSVRYQWIERMYLATRRNVTFCLHGNMRLRKILKVPNQLIKRALNFNRNPVGQISVSPTVRELLTQFYDKEYL